MSLIVNGGPAFFASVPSVPAVPARRDAPIGVVVHVLTEEAGLIARAIQPGSDGASLLSAALELVPPAARKRVAVDFSVVGVLAALDRSPTRAAQWEGGGHVGELDALAGDVVLQRWHCILGGRELVVGEDEDYVRLGLTLRLHPYQRHTACEQHSYSHRSQHQNRSSHFPHPC